MRVFLQVTYHPNGVEFRSINTASILPMQNGKKRHEKKLNINLKNLRNLVFPHLPILVLIRFEELGSSNDLRPWMTLEPQAIPESLVLHGSILLTNLRNDPKIFICGPVQGTARPVNMTSVRFSGNYPSIIICGPSVLKAINVLIPLIEIFQVICITRKLVKRPHVARVVLETWITG